MEALLLWVSTSIWKPAFPGICVGSSCFDQRLKFSKECSWHWVVLSKNSVANVGVFIAYSFLVGTPYDDIDHKHWHLDVGVKRWSLFSNSGPISVRSYPSPTDSYFWQTEPVEIIGLECGVLQLLLFSDIEDNWRIWPSLLAIDLSPLVCCFILTLSRPLSLSPWSLP